MQALTWLAWPVRLLAAAGLAVDAYVHADLAGRYDAVTGTIGQGDMFRIEAAVAALVALAVVVVPRRATFAAACLVAASALGAILLYRYDNVGTLGPLPNMYEPIWFAEKAAATAAEAVAFVASGLGLTLAWKAARQRRRVT